MLGDGWDVALAVVGSVGVWGALERGLQLFTWQGLACRCGVVGVGGDADGWGRTQSHCPSSGGAHAVATVLWRGRGLTPFALCSELFCCFQNPPPGGGPTASSCLQMLI